MGPPHFRAAVYTPEQLAMLELLGNPAIIRDSSVVLWHSTGSATAEVPSIAPTHTAEHLCPIVHVLGRERAILPNGDIESCD